MYIHNSVHLSGYEKGSVVFPAFGEIFHIPTSNLTPSSLTLQEKILCKHDTRIQKAEAGRTD